MTTMPSRSGAVTGTIQHDGKPLHLASRFDPVSEARKLLDEVDLGKHACVVLLGLGLGHHVEELLQRMPLGRIQSVILIHEPDLGLLRAVMEQVDLPWIAHSNIILTSGVTDRSELMRRIEKYGGLMTQGTVLVTHPLARRLHATALARFGQTVQEVLAFCRTNIATTLVNASRTVRNLSANIGHYAAGATTDALHMAAEGCVGVCVGAGPSLANNVDLLARP